MNQNGYTLFQLSVAILVAAFLVLAIEKGKILIGKRHLSFRKVVETRNEMELFASMLQKHAISNDLRFLAFSSLGSAQGSAFRFLVPQFGVCADLSTQNCADNSALLFATYNEPSTAMVTAVCSLSPTQWLVDLSNLDLGVASDNGNGFTITGPVPGKVTIESNTVLGLKNSPYVSLWVAQGVPSKLTVSQDPITGAFSPPGLLDSNPDCLKNLKVILQGTPAFYDLSRLYVVSVAPLTGAQFTNGTSAVTGEEMVTIAGSFPLPLFTASILSIGIIPHQDSRRSYLAAVKCRSVGGQIVCDGDEFWRVPKVSRLRIDEEFLYPFTSSTAKFYELATHPSQKTCSDSCEVLPLPQNNAIPILAGTQESISNLSAQAFSFFKQNFVSRFRFRLTSEGKEYSFALEFP